MAETYNSWFLHRVPSTTQAYITYTHMPKANLFNNQARCEFGRDVHETLLFHIQGYNNSDY